jgi:thiazole synthase
MKDIFNIGKKKLTSRLFTGSGKYPDSLIKKVLSAAGAEVITIALRRMDAASRKNNILNAVPKGAVLMPNTSGAQNASEAVRIARIAREVTKSNWIKIEIITDNKYLFPDNKETVEATKILAKEGFEVFPYIMPDLITAKELETAGATAVMPLGAPIGTNRGLATKDMLQILINEIKLPVIVDAGLGLPSHAAQAMEMGAAACLVNTAISSADNPVLMAEAFKFAVLAGRKAFLAGAGATSQFAKASSPLTGFLFK